MSNDALNWGWTIKEITPLQKLIAIALADYADKEGYCWPSNRSLAARCNVSVRTVQRHLRILEEKNLVIKEARERKDGSATSNGYLLAVPVKPKLPSPYVEPDIPPKLVEACGNDPIDIPGTITEPPSNLQTHNLDLKSLSLDKIPNEVLKSFREGVRSGKIKNKPAYLNTLLSNHIADDVIDNLLDDESQSGINEIDNAESELISEIRHFENLRDNASVDSKSGLDVIITKLKVKLSKL